MNTSETADTLIIALVTFFDKHPSELSEPGFGLDGWDLAVQAKLLSQEEAEKRRRNFLSGAMDDLPSAFHILVERGWAKTSDRGAYGKNSKALFPTASGIDYAHEKMRLLSKAPPKWQATPRRAWQDTERFRQSAKYFWTIEMLGTAIFGAVGGFGGYGLVPSNATPLQQYAYPTIGSAIGLIIGFVVWFALIYLWNLIRAPYRQRDELRAELEKSNGLPPLSNRKELVTAIAEAKIATIDFIESKIALKKNPKAKGFGKLTATLEFRNDFGRFDTALKHLDKEQLVAGANYEAFTDPLIDSMQSAIVSVKSKSRLEEYRAELEESVRKTIKDIDEINRGK